MPFLSQNSFMGAYKIQNFMSATIVFGWLMTWGRQTMGGQTCTKGRYCCHNIPKKTAKSYVLDLYYFDAVVSRL
jgi:hypothetical protein